jgi:hypothetical protein
MSLFNIGSPPRLPDAPAQYDPSYMSKMLNILYLYFQNTNAVQPINIAKLNIDVNTLPTDADLADLRVGDVYRDTADDSLKIKV